MSGIDSASELRRTGTLDLLLGAAENANVIWDFDGVVANSEPLQAESYRILLERMGNSPRDDFFIDCVGNPEPRIWQMLNQAGYRIEGAVDALISDRRDVYLRLAAEQLQPSWVAQLLPSLFAPLANAQYVISAGDPFAIERLLRRWGLDQHLDYRAPVGTKREQLVRVWDSGPSMTIEDNLGYLELAAAAGSFPVRIVHEMSDLNAESEAEVTLTI